MDAGNTAKLGRDVRFQFVPGTPVSLGAICSIRCAECASEFTVKALSANYFFTCPQCKRVGNLPGVFASQVDRDTLSGGEVEFTKVEERKERLAKIREHFAPPEVEPPAPPVVRKQTS